MKFDNEMEDSKEYKEAMEQAQTTAHGGDRYYTGFVTGLALAGLIALIAFLVYVIVFGGIRRLQRNNVGDVNIEQNKEINSSMRDIGIKIEYLAGIIQTYYLNEMETDDIIEGIYKGIFESLGDPYSEYYTAKEYKEMMNSSNGQFVGIGVSIIEEESGYMRITGFLQGNKAEEAGLKVGDLIVKVDGEDIANIEGDVIEKIKGEEGTTVNITVRREEESKEDSAKKDTEKKDSAKEYVAKESATKELSFDVTRALVDEVSVSSKMLDGGIGYIYILSYDANTPDQFKDKLKELKEQDMKGLIIDERYNGGGLLTAVTDIADCIMGEGRLVTIKDRNGEVTQAVDTTDEIMLDVPMVLLVNEYSASASEVLAGAVRDREIGKLVGTTTFGKGIVQSVIPLNDGSAVKVTTERYYTPSGDYIHEKGIEPDYVVEVDKDQLKKGIDNQLEKAKEVLKESMDNKEK